MQTTNPKHPQKSKNIGNTRYAKSDKYKYFVIISQIKPDYR